MKKLKIQGANELDRLLERLVAILPIVRRQQCDADREAQRAYFEATGQPQRATERLIVLSVEELCAIDYRPCKTAEWHELRSIGLAVAAFGGSDAISDVFYRLEEKRCPDCGYVLVAWDGMAGHWR